MSVCKVQRLYNKELVRLLGEYPKERQHFRQLAEHRLRASEKETLDEHAFFKDFDRAFLNSLRQKFRMQVFFANEVLMRQSDVADSMFILGPDSFVTMSVDHCQVKKLVGRACLGAKALLSSRPVKRASTVVTQTVCAVRILTREDWQDALKLHPQHQKWLATFTREQMGKVNEAMQSFTKKLAWEKIHQRELTATMLHCDRLADPELYVKQRTLSSRSRRLEGLSKDSRATEVNPAEAGPAMLHAPIDNMPSAYSQVTPEIWECFNGGQVMVPHTRLPELHRHTRSSTNRDDAGTPVPGQRRSMSRTESDDSITYSEYEKVLQAPSSDHPEAST